MLWWCGGQMEDAATAEISRVQVHQWARHGVTTSDEGVKVTRELVARVVEEEAALLVKAHRLQDDRPMALAR